MRQIEMGANPPFGFFKFWLKKKIPRIFLFHRCFRLQLASAYGCEWEFAGSRSAGHRSHIWGRYICLFIALCLTETTCFRQDDFKIIPPTWSTQPLQFMIRLTPPPGMVQEVYAQVWLVFRWVSQHLSSFSAWNQFCYRLPSIRFTRSYPNNPPLLEVEKIGGLSDEQLSELQCLLEKEVAPTLPDKVPFDS